MEINPVTVTIVLNSGDQLDGEINIMQFKRCSDFIEEDKAKHIKLFNTKKGNSFSSSYRRFIMIPKINILYYEPVQEVENE